MAIRSLSVVIPTFNEELSLPETLQDAISTLSKAEIQFELLVVDDGSTDGTAALVAKFAGQDPRVRLIQQDRNCGVGASARNGFNAARYSHILYTDADHPFDFAIIPRLLRRAERNEFIAGFRVDRDTEGPLRYLLGLAYRWAVRLTYGLNYRDIGFALKLFPASLLLDQHLYSRTGAIDVELLSHARHKNYPVRQYPVNYVARKYGISRIATPANIVAMAIELLRIRRQVLASARVPVSDRSVEGRRSQLRLLNGNDEWVA